MAVQIDQVPRAQNDGTGMTFTLGVGAPGGGIGLRVIVDDTIITNQQDFFVALEAIQKRVTTKTWPIS